MFLKPQISEKTFQVFEKKIVYLPSVNAVIDLIICNKSGIILLISNVCVTVKSFNFEAANWKICIWISFYRIFGGMAKCLNF